MPDEVGHRKPCARELFFCAQDVIAGHGVLSHHELHRLFHDASFLPAPTDEDFRLAHTNRGQLIAATYKDMAIQQII